MIRSAAGGDPGARDDFAATYTAPIHAYLSQRWRGTRLAAEIEDGLHDVLLECMKPGGVLDRAEPRHGGFRALLYGVVRNVARRIEDRSGRPTRLQVEHTSPLEHLASDDESLARAFDRAWALSLLREAVLRHAKAARQGDAGTRRRFRILRLRHQQGLPVREIARHLEEADVDAVHNAYRRARREFRGFLREVVARHTGVRPEELDAECRRVTALLES